MVDEGSITRWIHDVRHGDSVAAERLWTHYYDRLIRLARGKLRGSLRRVADEEDVVLHAFNSFYSGVVAGRFPRLNDRAELWQILVMLTARKATDQCREQNRKKRGGGMVRGDSAFMNTFDVNERNQIDQIVGSEPSPEFAAQVAEEFRRLLNLLENESLRIVALAKMEGYSTAEIAAKMGVQTRTVERKLRYIRELWSAEWELYGI